MVVSMGNFFWSNNSKFYNVVSLFLLQKIQSYVQLLCLLRPSSRYDHEEKILREYDELNKHQLTWLLTRELIFFCGIVIYFEVRIYKDCIRKHHRIPHQNYQAIKYCRNQRSLAQTEILSDRNLLSLANSTLYFCGGIDTITYSRKR